jgi:hypothetical protein
MYNPNSDRDFFMNKFKTLLDFYRLTHFTGAKMAENLASK